MDSADHERHMREALEEARDALARGDRPVGCVIVHGDRIVGRGSNHEFTRKSKFEHAETVALRSCAEYLFRHSPGRKDVCHGYDGDHPENGPRH